MFKPLTNKLIGFIPAQLPRGAQEFDGFCKSIFATYSIPDMPSYRLAVASMIMHLPPTMSHKSKNFFAKSIRKAQANEVAYQFIQETREAEAVAAKAKQEATVNNPEASNSGETQSEFSPVNCS